MDNVNRDKHKTQITMKKIRTLLTVFTILLITSASAQNDLTGQILYHDSTGAPLPDVQLELYDTEGNHIATTYTNENGEYLFSDLPIGSYVIDPSYDAEAGGVDMGDATLIMMNLLGLYEFDPIEELAADVDGDDEITWNDYWFIVINYFINGEPFPVGDWVFEEMSAEVGAKEGDNDNNDYGNSAGDVAGAWEPGQREKPFVQAAHRTYELIPESTSTVSVTTSSKMDISGAGIVINYPADAIEIVNAESGFDNAEIAVHNDQIRMAWASQSPELKQLDSNSELMTLEIASKGNIENAVKFHLSSESHFTGDEGKIIKDAKIEIPAITENQNHIEISGIYPNPVVATSKLNFNLAKAAHVKITLMDISGQTVDVVTNRAFSKGSNKVMVSKNDLPQGIYVYKVFVNHQDVGKANKVIIAE